MTEDPKDDKKKKRAWPLVVAALLALAGAGFGGVFGGMAAAFAGDSWWPDKSALNWFQYAITTGGICVGAAPGLIWLLCLGHRWALPLLGIAACALLLPVFEASDIQNNTLGPLYAGTIAVGFVLGTALWLVSKRSTRPKTTPLS